MAILVQVPVKAKRRSGDAAARRDLPDRQRRDSARLLTGLCYRSKQASWSAIRASDQVHDQRETHLGNIEVIPTPGHSPGSTCFLVASATGKNYLFTGDTLLLGSDNRWRAGFIPGFSKEDDKEALADSLSLLRTLNPDLVFGSAYTGDKGFEDVSDGSWTRKVDDALRVLANTP